MNTGGADDREIRIAGLGDLVSLRSFDFFVAFTPGNSARQGVMSFAPDTVPERFTEFVLWDDDLRIIFGDGTGGVIFASTSITRAEIADGALHRVGGSYDPVSGIFRFYLDGEYQTSVAFDSALVEANLTGTGTLTLGAASASFYPRSTLDGFIGGLALYDTMLDDADFAALGASTPPDPADPRLFHYWLADGRPEALPDLVGGADGAGVNIATIAAFALASDDDIISGEAGDDSLSGGPGADTLDGGDGADRLDGGVGADSMTGGPGADIFVAIPDGSALTVTDFEDGVDLLDLTAFDRDVAIAAMGAAQAGSVILDFPDGTEVTLGGITLADFGFEDVVLAHSNAPPTGVPVILGTPEEDQTLVADVSGVSDPDGILPDSASFQWLRDGAVIAGATAATYTLTQDDVGAAISVHYSFTDGGGTVETVTSAATVPVANVNDPPSGAVVILGT
ncbi:MAG: hypothetical protein D6811_04395, partial [Alphaproteobacteria bacterium]